MARTTFEDLRFTDEKESVRVTFLGSFHFTLKKADLEKIGDFTIGDDFIDFDASEKSARNKLNILIDRGLSNLISQSGKNAYYIHKNSGIPLIGSQYFGLVDRNTNLIELRPQTGCNLDCIYCSVDEGHGRKQVDYVVELDYLLEEFKKLADFKEINDIEAHINPQGEPLLYSKLPELVRGLSEIDSVDKISIDTNGTLLTKKMIDSLVKAGLTQLNVSINAINPESATKLACQNYNSKHVLSMIDYAKDSINVIIAPILVPGYNEKDVIELISFAKDRKLRICIQNYLYNKHGRNPVKQLTMGDFYKIIKRTENEFDYKLTFSSEDFSVHDTKKLPSPFRKGQRIAPDFILPGRLTGETLAVARDRVIQVRGRAKGIVTISRTKHNIFKGK